MKEHADSLIGIGRRLLSIPNGQQQQQKNGHIHSSDVASLISKINNEISSIVDPLQSTAAQILSVALSSTAQSPDEGVVSPGSESRPTSLSSLETKPELNEKSKKLSRRKDFIVSELIQTERAYINQLNLCLKTFYSVFTGEQTGTIPVPPYWIGKENIIFGNIREILDFHQSVFLKHLEVYEDVPEDMGHVFVTFADRFNVLYVQYCKNKPESDQLLLQYGTSFFDEVQNSANILDPIGSYLIKPVQRITKYQLLLKDLLTCCDDVNGEIKEALDVMTNVPKKANDAIHFSMLTGMPANNNEQTLGELHLQDIFTVWSGKQMLAIRKGRDRHVFLFDTCVIFSKEAKDMTLPNQGKMRYLYKTSLPLREMNVVENVEAKSDDSEAANDCRFALSVDDVRIVLKASRIDVKQLWVRKIREIIREPDRFSLPSDSRLAEQLQRSRLTAIKHAISRHNLLQVASAATAADNDDNGSQTDPTNSAGDASSIDEKIQDIAILLNDVKTLTKGQQVEVIDWQVEHSVVRVNLQEIVVPTCHLQRAKSVGSLHSNEQYETSFSNSRLADGIFSSTAIANEGKKQETAVASLKLVYHFRSFNFFISFVIFRRWFSGKRRIKGGLNSQSNLRRQSATNDQKLPETVQEEVISSSFVNGKSGYHHAASSTATTTAIITAIDTVNGKSVCTAAGTAATTSPKSTIVSTDETADISKVFTASFPLIVYCYDSRT